MIRSNTFSNLLNLNSGLMSRTNTHNSFMSVFEQSRYNDIKMSGSIKGEVSLWDSKFSKVHKT